jgi:hypothetical protein
MNEAVESVALQARLVVVNLDPVWPFAQLVRRHALDIFADPRKRSVVQFRTIGTEASDNENARLKIWGVQRPRFYSDDLESMVADIGGDIDDLASQRIARLAVIFVADPARRAANKIDAIDVMRRVEALVDDAEDVAQDIRRYFCFRDETNDERMTHLQGELATLLRDPTGMGRQLADKAFGLSPRQPAARSDEAHAMSFRLLRSVIDLVSDASDAGPVAERASPARQLLAHPRPLLLLQPSGFPAATTSARMAQIISGYVASASIAAANNREAGRGDDSTATKVKEVIDKIETQIVAEMHRWDNIIGPIELAESRIKALPTEFDALRAVKMWWRSGVERTVDEKTRNLPNQLEKSLSSRLDHFKSVRERAEEDIAGRIDPEIRSLISRIPIVSGGVTGGVTDEIERLTIAIKRKRRSWRDAANQHRAEFMYALEGKEQAGKPTTPIDVPTLEDIAIDRIDAGRTMKVLIPGARTAYQGLVPLHYLVMMVLFSVGCLVTVGAHSLGKANGRALVDGLYFSTALYVAVIVAMAFSFAVLFIWARWQRSAFISIVDELNDAHDAAWLVLEKILSHGSRYIAISRQIFFFDILINEIERRTGEADRDALNLALADIGARSGDGVEAGDDFYRDMAAELSMKPVSRWIRTMLDSDKLLSRATKQPSRRRRRVAGSDAGHEMQTRTFSARQVVRVVPIEVSEHPTTETAAT